MSGWLVDLLILLAIIAVVAVAGWYVLQQVHLPEPLQRILMIVLVVVAAVVAIMILLHLRAGGKLTAVEPFPATSVALRAAGTNAGTATDLPRLLDAYLLLRS